MTNKELATKIKTTIKSVDDDIYEESPVMEHFKAIFENDPVWFVYYLAYIFNSELELWCDKILNDENPFEIPASENSAEENTDKNDMVDIIAGNIFPEKFESNTEYRIKFPDTSDT